MEHIGLGPLQSWWVARSKTALIKLTNNGQLI